LQEKNAEREVLLIFSNIRLPMAPCSSWYRAAAAEPRCAKYRVIVIGQTSDGSHPRLASPNVGSDATRPSTCDYSGPTQPAVHRCPNHRQLAPDDLPRTLGGIGVVDPFPAVADSEHGPSDW